MLLQIAQIKLYSSVLAVTVSHSCGPIVRLTQGARLSTKYRIRQASCALVNGQETVPEVGSLPIAASRINESMGGNRCIPKRFVGSAVLGKESSASSWGSGKVRGGGFAGREC